MAYTDVFGGSTVQPSDVQFAAVTLSANITTAWPPYATGAIQVLARIMKVSATTGSLSISLPDATKTGSGQDVLFDNSGSNTFTVLDYAGNIVATVAAGQVKYFYLSDATTQAGTWRVTIFGVGASALDASALTGYGLKAIGSTINTAAVATVIGGDTTVISADRSKVFVWSGASGTLTLPTTTGSTSDFAIEVRNQGTGTLTIAPVGGVLIDASATITLSVQESCFVHMGATDWYTVGRGRNTAFNFTQLVKATTGDTTVLTLTEASNVVQKYTGALVSNATITLPAVVQVYYVNNQTTGTYTLTFGCAGGGTSVAVTQLQAAILFCDGTNIINANTSLAGGISSIVFAAGSVTVPSVAIAESVTGLYASGSHEIGFTCNGVYVGKWTSTGLAVVGAVTATSFTGTIGAVSPSTGAFTTLTSSSTTTLNGTTIPATSTLVTTAAGTAVLATSLAGGSGGTIPYQSASGVTAMLANGTAGQILQANGTTLAPTWVAAPLSVAAQTHAASTKVTPVDADEIPLADSAASFALKNLTWANLKATAKTYFDTLYAGKGANTDITSLSAVTAINSGPLAGFRNKIINGDFRVAQRTALVLTTNTTGFGQGDRFQMTTAGFTTQSISFIQSNAVLVNGLAASAVSSVTTTGTGSITFITRLESADTIALKSKTVTFSVVVNQQTTAAINAQLVIRKANALDNFTGVTLISAQTASAVPDSVATTLTYTITLGSTDAANGLQLELNFPTIGALTSKAIFHSGWQLEVGSVATAFEQRPLQVETALCQRYYYRITPGANNLLTTAGYGLSTTTGAGIISFPVTMRIAPTALEQTGTAGDYGLIRYGAALTTTCSAVPVFTSASAAYAYLTFTVASGLTNGTAGAPYAVGASAYLGFSAEL